MKYIKEELEQLILVEKLSYREIGRRYGVSDVYIKKISLKLGIELPIRKKNVGAFHKKGIFKRFCKECGVNFRSVHSAQIFCTHSCSVTYMVNKKYKHYTDNQESYCTVDVSMVFIKRHLLLEQNKCCDICNMPNKWNNKLIIFILDHIDGDASNNFRSNLRLVCPNCDSQLDTFKNRNKNSARTERYKRSYK